MQRRFLYVAVTLVAVLGLGVSLATPRASQVAPATVEVDADDIGGVVTGPQGPEAGVWVIAETQDLPTQYSKTVVTDDQGRYLVPDLPEANYSVWVRGYGPGGFAEGRGRAWKHAEPHGRGCAERNCRGPVLPV